MTHKFADKLAGAPSTIILYVNPVFELLPLPILRYDDPFLPFAKAIIPATHDLVAGYLFDFASYLSMAGAGAVALERSIALVPQDRVRILHGAFTGTSYSAMTQPTAFDLDAITVTNESDYDHYTDNPPYTALLTSESATHNHIAPDMSHIRYNDQVYRLTTNDILYTSKTDDFVDKLREGIKTHL